MRSSGPKTLEGPKGKLPEDTGQSERDIPGLLKKKVRVQKKMGQAWTGSHEGPITGEQLGTYSPPSAEDEKITGAKLKITQKGLDALRKDRDRPKVKTQVKITKKGRDAIKDEVEMDEAETKLTPTKKRDTWAQNFKAQTARRLGDIRRRNQAQAHSPGQRVNARQEEVEMEGSLNPQQKAAREKARGRFGMADRKHGGSPHAAHAAGFGTGGDHQGRGVKKVRGAKEEVEMDEWGDTGPLAKQDVRIHGRRDIARQDSDRLAKQQADREKKYQKAKKTAKESYMNRYHEEAGFEFDSLRSSFLGEAEWKVKLKGLPAFYVPGKSAGSVKQMLRKQLKRPQDDIESIERSMGSEKKKDFRDRAAGKG
jgi:hypothetical protein